MNNNIKLGVWVAAVLLNGLGLTVSAQGASFDCGKASTKVEKMICTTALTELDDEMNVAYQWALMRVDDKTQVIKPQRKWLETRNACELDMACLWDAYVQRIRALEAQVKRPGCYTLEPILDGGMSGNVRPIEPVCIVLEQNLNRFCDQPPMVCGLKIAPEFRDKITLPTWMPIESKNKLALIEAFIRAPWQVVVDKNVSNQMWNQERPDIEKAFKNKRLSFMQSNLDLYNLGKAQPAYRLDYDYGNCIANNPDLNKREKWADLVIHPAAVQIQHAPEVVRSIFTQYRPRQHEPLGEVMLFEGKVYDYGMGSHEPAKRASDDTENAPYRSWYIGFGVNRHERWSNGEDTLLHMDNICRFQYQPIQANQAAQGETK